MLISGDGVETTLNHYFEFAESDGDTISGIAVRYGDRYETDYANYEFVHGAFGDVKSVDAIANVQHRRDKPLARNRRRACVLGIGDGAFGYPENAEHGTCKGYTRIDPQQGTNRLFD